jgi:hypothetical protein
MRFSETLWGSEIWRKFTRKEIRRILELAQDVSEVWMKRFSFARWLPSRFLCVHSTFSPSK